MGIGNTSYLHSFQLDKQKGMIRDGFLEMFLTK
jgi:hypothetical protein